MQVAFTQEQELVRSTTERFIGMTCPVTEVRRLMESGQSPATQYWRASSELGWYAMFAPEECGGGSASGEAFVDAALVAVQRGRSLQPGNFAASNAVAALLAALPLDATSTEILEEYASGNKALAWTGIVPDHQGTHSLAPRCTILPDNTLRVDGVLTMVQDADRPGWLLFTSSVDATRSLLLLVPLETRGITLSTLEGIDLTRRFFRVTFDDVTLDPTTLAVHVPLPSEALETACDVASMLSCAEATGAMERLMEITVDYAKSRIAFGRPIGSFQAIKHLLANLSLLVEASRAMTFAAARSLQSQSIDRSMVVSMAKSFVAEATTDVAQGCLQVHGGIGYTWEHDLHLYLRRLACDRVLFGDARSHRERLLKLGGFEITAGES